MSAKKARERRVVERLRELWLAFPAGDIDDGERPDFIVTAPDGTRIGIEVTSYHRPAMTEQDQLRWRVARRLSVAPGFQELPPMSVLLHFHDRFPLHKNTVSALVAEVAPLVIGRAAGLPLGGRDTIDFRSAKLPTHVTMISLDRLPDSMQSFCGPVSTTFVPTLGIDDVQAEINKKVPKAGAYGEQCDQAILVIVVHGVSPGTIAELSPAVLTHPFRSPFCKVLVLVDGREVVELAHVAG